MNITLNFFIAFGLKRFFEPLRQLSMMEVKRHHHHTTSIMMTMMMYIVMMIIIIIFRWGRQ